MAGHGTRHLQSPLAVRTSVRATHQFIFFSPPPTPLLCSLSLSLAGCFFLSPRLTRKGLVLLRRTPPTCLPRSLHLFFFFPFPRAPRTRSHCSHTHARSKNSPLQGRQEEVLLLQWRQWRRRRVSQSWCRSRRRRGGYRRRRGCRRRRWRRGGGAEGR